MEKKSHPLLKAQVIAEKEENRYVHPLNPEAIRWTKSLGDMVGLEKLGAHLVRIKPGCESTRFHFHHIQEELMYVLSGRGIVDLGEDQFELAAGDFMGFTAPSLPHGMHNPFEEDFVYLLVGERVAIDVVDYPKIGKRCYKYNKDVDLVNIKDVGEFYK